MNSSDKFTAYFWGVRGTLPVPGEAMQRYGSNTSCVEVRCGGHNFIFDAGTGLKLLGDNVKDEVIDIFLSHTHIDHILGLPFFSPAYNPARRVRVWAGHLTPDYTLQGVLGMMMQPPLFPITPAHFKAQFEYHDFIAGQALQATGWPQGISVNTLLLNHPDKATGYRINYNGKSLCYITDYEHVRGCISDDLVQFIDQADCLIYDATYTDEEFDDYVGWGHSTWQQALRLADAAKVKTVVLFHHDLNATDAILDARSVTITRTRPGTLLAKEGLQIVL